MMLTIYMLNTCIANSRFIWQPLKAALWHCSQDHGVSAICHPRQQLLQQLTSGERWCTAVSESHQLMVEPAGRFILLLQIWHFAHVSGANILGFGLIGTRCRDQSPSSCLGNCRGILIVAAHAQVV